MWVVLFVGSGDGADFSGLLFRSNVKERIALLNAKANKHEPAVPTKGPPPPKVDLGIKKPQPKPTAAATASPKASLNTLSPKQSIFT